MNHPDLKKELLDGLNSYHDLEALGQTQLALLRVTDLYHPRIPMASLKSELIMGLAIRRLLDAALLQLDQNQPVAAALLRERFRQERQARQISDERRVGVTTIYEHQKKAVAALAAIVTEMEAQAHSERGARLRSLMASLPAPTYEDFVGREELFQEISAALQSSVTNAGSPVAITGLGGLGKTSAAREALVRWVSDQQPAVERILWSTVSQPAGFAGLPAERRERYTLDHVLNQLGEQLNESLTALPNNDRRMQILARHLAEVPSLVVIDNIETRDDVALALTVTHSLAPVAQMLLTSRHRIDAPAFQSFELSELTAQEAIQLLQSEAKRLRLAPLDESTTQTIWQQLGGNPLALKLVVAQLRALPVAQVLRTLQQPAESMHELYAHVYDTSWSLLSRQAQEILLGLLLLPPVGATWEGLQVAAALSGDADDDLMLSRAIDELSSLSLLQVSPALDPVYSLHRLTYRYLEYRWGLLGDEPVDDR